ncbi:hypothetical protein pdam_00005777, partial [Pocillopora damicornis]
NRTDFYNAATLHFIDGPPNISLSTVVQTLPDYKVTFLVTGTPPINTVILSHSAVFVDTTNTSVAVQLEEGNFVCVATNKFGFDLRMFSVTFSDCGPSCSSEWSISHGNTLSCTNVTGAHLSNCLPASTEKL